jgi:hypothetical protein
MNRLRYSAICLIPVLCGPTLTIVAPNPTLAAEVSTSKPVRKGLPGRRTGGGARASENACTKITAAEDLTAIVPVDAAVKTIDEKPKLMFFVPPGTAPRQGEIVLLGADGKALDRQTMPLGQDPAFVQVPVTDKLALTTDEAYSWQFKLRCADTVAVVPQLTALTKSLTKQSNKPGLPANVGSTNPAGPTKGEGVLSVNGNLTRVKPESLAMLSSAEQSSLQGPQSLARTSLLIKAGLWSDAAAMVCHLVTDKATPAATKRKGQDTWKGMLSTLDLAPLRSQPMAKMLIRPFKKQMTAAPLRPLVRSTLQRRQNP